MIMHRLILHQKSLFYMLYENMIDDSIGRLAEQCHTQKFDLRCFKSDFDAVKSKFGLLIE